MNIKDFFKKIGHGFLSIYHAVEKVIPEEYLVLGVPLVKEAAIKFAENSNRREWVVHELVTRVHLPESIARIIVEVALHRVKDEIEKVGTATTDLPGA